MAGPPSTPHGMLVPILWAALVVLTVDALPITIRPPSPSANSAATSTGDPATATSGPMAGATQRSAPIPMARAAPEASPCSEPTLSPDGAARQSMKGIARIVSSVDKGTVFLLDRKGGDALVVTNQRVVDRGTTVQIVTHYKFEHTRRVLKADEDVDLAVVAVGDITGIPPVKWGNALSLQTGQPLYAIGFPRGLKGDFTVTRGNVVIDPTSGAQISPITLGVQ